MIIFLVVIIIILFLVSLKIIIYETVKSAIIDANKEIKIPNNDNS